MSKNKNKDRKMQTSEKEHCSKCLAEDFAISLNPAQTRHCSCGHVWAPKTPDQMAYDSLKVDYNKLLAYAGLLHNEVTNLSEQLSHAIQTNDFVDYESVLKKLSSAQEMGREISQKVLS